VSIEGRDIQEVIKKDDKEIKKKWWVIEERRNVILPSRSGDCVL